MEFDEQYWNHRYKTGQTGWDIGYPSTPIKEYIDQLSDKSLNILIPGCGNAYEAAYLLQADFRRVTLIDIADEAVKRMKQKFSADHINIIHGDFFQHAGQYDLIIEQTFFCALHPSQRKNYAKKIVELLKPGGKLAGVLFNREFDDGPPFGGRTDEYIELFSGYFTRIKIEACYNSILHRKGTEVFIVLRKDFPA
jgi:SAM-dependent methyltransferase